MQQWDRDSVNSISAIVGNTWDSTITYGVGGTNIVYASDGNYYVSIQAGNLGHDPAAGANPLWWKPEFDYLAIGQTIVAAGYVAVGDATTGLSGISMVTKGGILAGDGTTAPQVLPVGTNGQVLTADSGEATGLKYTTPAAVNGWQYLSTVTAVAASTVDVETGFSATYDDYVIVASGVTFSANDTLRNRWKISGAYDTGANYDFSTYGGSTTAQTSIDTGIIGVSKAIGFTWQLNDVNSSAQKIAYMFAGGGGTSIAGTPTRA